MTFDMAVGVILLVLAGICYVGYRMSSEVVYVKHHDQKVGK